MILILKNPMIKIYYSINRLILLFLLVFTFLSCKNEEPIPDIPIVPNDTIIVPKDSTKNDNPIFLRTVSPFPFGGALNVTSLKTNFLYRTTVINEFNSLTAENAMKMKNISIGRGSYNWSDADYLVNFAVENKMRVHGHALIWYNSTPTWVANFVGTTDDWKAILREYIVAVVGRYKGKIQSWDVLNEAINDDGSYRDCIWKQKLGLEYIDLCFKYAREADPNVLLFYNEYGNEYAPVKRVAINTMVNGLISRGIPIDGVGLQMHTSATRSDADIQTAISYAAQTGLKIHVSEFDIRANTSNDVNQTAITPAQSIAQKQKYKVAVKALFDLQASQRYGFTFWGVYDGQTWLTNNSSYNNCTDWPLPFDNSFNRKDAYYGILDGLGVKY